MMAGELGTTWDSQLQEKAVWPRDAGDTLELGHLPGHQAPGWGWAEGLETSPGGQTQVLGHGRLGLFPRNWSGTGRPVVPSALTINSKAGLSHTTATRNLLVFIFFQLVQVWADFSCDGLGQIPTWKSVLSQRAESFQAVGSSRSPQRNDHSIFLSQCHILQEWQQLNKIKMKPKSILKE